MSEAFCPFQMYLNFSKLKDIEILNLDVYRSFENTLSPN